MATTKQVQANRVNARQSTGPRSKRGKSVVKFNAVTHGLTAVEVLLPGEDPKAYGKLREEVYHEFNPEDGYERLLVSQLCQLLWRLRRMGRVETGLFLHHMREMADVLDESINRAIISRMDDQLSDEQVEQANLGEAFAWGCERGDIYSKLSRYETAIIRNVERLLRGLDNHRRRKDAEGPLVEYEQGGKGPVQKAG